MQCWGEQNLYFLLFNLKLCTEKTQIIFGYRKAPLANNSSLHLQSRKLSWLENFAIFPFSLSLSKKRDTCLCVQLRLPTPHPCLRGSSSESLLASTMDASQPQAAVNRVQQTLADVIARHHFLYTGISCDIHGLRNR